MSSTSSPEQIGDPLSGTITQGSELPSAVAEVASVGPLTTRGTGASSTGGTPTATTRGDGRLACAPVRRRSTYQPGERIALPETASVVIDEFLISSGEAELYLCRVAEPIDDGDAQSVIKVYHHGAEPNPKVLEVWQGLPTDGILRLISHGALESGRAFERLEYARGGTLAGRLPIRDLDELHALVRSVSEGLNTLHSHDIIHRDLKPENLLCRDSEGRDVVLSDFGVATMLGGRSLVISRAGFGTPDYMAPEQSTALTLDGLEKNVLSRSVDFYALGMTILACYSGRSPFAGHARTAGELLALKQHGRVPIPDDLPEDWKRLIRALLSVDPSTRLDYDGVQRWLRGEKISVPDSRTVVQYPQVIFRTERGEDVRVSDPVHLAELLEGNPNVGRRFFYGRYIERAGWEAVNLGLSAALTQIIEDLHPQDQAAGLTAAIYTLDPSRPYRGHDDSTHETYVELAEHLLTHETHYANELVSPSHRLWLYLETRPDPRVRSELLKRIAAFLEPSSNEERRYAVRRAIHWLRLLDGISTLEFTDGGELRSATDLLSYPVALQQRLASALSDKFGFFAAWIEETQPSVKESVEVWRAHFPGRIDMLSAAFGQGITVADSRVYQPTDIADGAPVVMHALWQDLRATGPESQEMERVREYLAAYWGISLPSLVFDLFRLRRTGGESESVIDSPYAAGMLSYVVRNVSDLLPSTQLQPPARSWDTVNAALQRWSPLIGSYLEVSDELAGEPWRDLMHDVYPHLFVAVSRLRSHGVAVPDSLLERFGDVALDELERPSAMAPFLLIRLLIFSKYLFTNILGSSDPAPSVARSAYASYFESLTPRLLGIYREARREWPGGTQGLSVEWLLHLTLRDTLPRFPDNAFVRRVKEELRAEETLHTKIALTIDAERQIAVSKVEAARQKAIDNHRTAQGSGSRGKVLRERNIFYIAAGFASFALVSGMFQFLGEVSSFQLMISAAAGLAGGSIALKRLSSLIPTAGRFAAGATVGVVAVATVFSLLQLIFLGIAAWRWREYDAARKAQLSTTDTSMLPPAQSAVFDQSIEDIKRQLDQRQHLWCRAVTREASLASDPWSVDIEDVRKQLSA